MGPGLGVGPEEGAAAAIAPPRPGPARGAAVHPATAVPMASGASPGFTGIHLPVAPSAVGGVAGEQAEHEGRATPRPFAAPWLGSATLLGHRRPPSTCRASAARVSPCRMLGSPSDWRKSTSTSAGSSGPANWAPTRIARYQSAIAWARRRSAHGLVGTKPRTLEQGVPTASTKSEGMPKARVFWR